MWPLKSTLKRGMDKSDFQMAEHLECPTDSPSTVRFYFWQNKKSSDFGVHHRKMFYELIWPDLSEWTWAKYPRYYFLWSCQTEILTQTRIWLCQIYHILYIIMKCRLYNINKWRDLLSMFIPCLHVSKWEF